MVFAPLVPTNYIPNACHPGKPGHFEIFQKSSSVAADTQWRHKIVFRCHTMIVVENFVLDRKDANSSFQDIIILAIFKMASKMATNTQ